MKLSLKTAQLLQELRAGEIIPDSHARGRVIDCLVEENILFRKGRHRKTINLVDEQGLTDFLANQLQIHDLQGFILAKKNENSSRSDYVKITTDSKHSKERAFKGFLVNCIRPVQAKLKGCKIEINPPKGSFQFISDYETFEVDEKVVIIGVENARNFSLVHRQAYLFPEKDVLFLSRYPQTQNQDVLQWLRSIPNKYRHFGDFDVAGIGIFMNEYQKHLGDRAQFFIPDGIDEKIKLYGNRKRYNLQKINFEVEAIQDDNLMELLQTIRRERKGLDQEVFIR